MTNHVLKNQNRNYTRQCMSAIPALRRLTRDYSGPAWAIQSDLTSKKPKQAGEMTQCLRALTALEEDLAQFPHPLEFQRL